MEHIDCVLCQAVSLRGDDDDWCRAFGVALSGMRTMPACPALKQSGIGREGGREGLLPFLESKTVLLDAPPARYADAQF